MIASVVHYIFGNEQEKEQARREIEKYGAIRTILQSVFLIVQEDYLPLLNYLFNNWETVVMDRFELLDLLRDMFRNGLIKAKSRKQIESILRLQYVKSHEDLAKMLLSKFNEIDRERVSKVISGLNRYELSMLLNRIDSWKDEYTTYVEKTKVKTESTNRIAFWEQLNEELLRRKVNCQSTCTLGTEQIVGIDYGGNLDKLQRKEIDVLFIGEAPGEDETKLGRPFVGRAGKELRRVIKAYLDDKISYVITNTCLCRPPNNRAPKKAEIECCRSNLEYLIRSVKPKLIVCLGETAIKALKRVDKLAEGVTSLHGRSEQLIVVDDFNCRCLYSVHPSFVIRPQSSRDKIDKKTALPEMCTAVLKLLNENTQTKQITKARVVPTIEVRKSLAYLKLPFFGNHRYSILEAQEHSWLETVLLVKDEETKETIKFIVERRDYCYKSDAGMQLITSAGPHLRLISHAEGREIASNSEVMLYDYDIDYTSKIMVDWKLSLDQPDELSVSSFTYCVLDIETLNEETMGFSPPEEARFEVPLATVYSSIDDTYHVFYVSDDEVQVQTNVKQSLIRCENELELLLKVIDLIKEHDVVTAWNISFDLGYIWTRLAHHGKDPKAVFTTLPDLEGVVVHRDHYVHIPGMICVDLLSAYRMISYGERESYSLSYIANYELGYTKTESGAMFGVIWKESKERAITYNVNDVFLVVELNKKLDLLNFLNQLRFTCNVSWSKVVLTSKNLDGLLYYFGKKQGLVIGRRIPLKGERKILTGGFVHNPIPGIHRVVQLDFVSLYPSIILCLNLGLETCLGKFATQKDQITFLRYLLVGGDDGETIQFLLYKADTRSYEEYTITCKQMKDFCWKYLCSISAHGVVFRNDKDSFFKTVLRTLIDKRNLEKELYKQTNEKSHYLKQWVYKILANALYGYLGSEVSRVYDYDLAMSITMTGQLLNKYVTLCVEKLGFSGTTSYDDSVSKEIALELLEKYYPTDAQIDNRKYVVYGDTDSLFVRIGDVHDEQEIMSSLEKALNSYTKWYEHTILGVPPEYSRLQAEAKYVGTMFLTDVKKRYAVLTTYPEVSLDVKGFEIKRSDYPKYFKEQFETVLYMLLKEQKDLSTVTTFIRSVEDNALLKLRKMDKDIGKPVSWSKSNYKVLPPAVKGMLLFNALFSNYFSPGSKGLLYQIRLYTHNIPGEKLRAFAESLKKYSVKDVVQEIKDTKWLVIPHDLSDYEMEKIRERIGDWFTPDPTFVETYWIDRMRELGLLVVAVLEV